MFWGAIADGYKSDGYIWEKETEEERKKTDQIVAEEKAADRRIVDEKRLRALIPGTEEYQHLQEIHNRIINGPRTAAGRQYPRPPPERVWKYRKIERQGTAGGIDWVRYREYILYPLLYPFLQHIKKENPTKEVWLVEDNAPGHKGAITNDLRWLKEMESSGIYRCQWPANSPDLNEIELVWDIFKDSIASKGPFVGASKATINKVKNTMVQKWAELSMDSIKTRCGDFKTKLELVLQNEGQNNFHG